MQASARDDRWTTSRSTIAPASPPLVSAMSRISGQFALLPIRNPKTRTSYVFSSLWNSFGSTMPSFVTPSVMSITLVARSASTPSFRAIGAAHTPAAHMILSA